MAKINLAEALDGIDLDDNTIDELTTKLEVADYVRKEMKSRKMTQAQLAKECKMSQPHISDFLSGDFRKWRMERVNRLAAVFRIQVKETRKYEIVSTAHP